MEQQLNLLDILDYIDPAMLDYQEWVNIGMALQHEGYTANDWDSWSMKDSTRYHPGECYSKWSGFAGSGITGGTIVQYAKDYGGWTPPKKENGHELDWNDSIDKDELVVVDRDWLEGKEVKEPSDEKWQPVNELIKYIEALFESTEHVGYVTETWEKDGKFLPKKGAFDRTAGQLIEELSKCNGDIGSVFGDYNKDVGAWIRFNPLDGKGVKDINVTDYRYALVESDNMELSHQNAIIRELELPVACLVHSGSKSIHAIVKIDATNYEEYKKRVNYLYEVCKKNGLKIDKQNKNPSRLSRMPGVTRNGKKQFLIDYNIGKDSWNDWYEWIEAVNDDLPDPENLNDVWNNMPPLADPLIHGILRKGHKMLMAGPAKAGKSFSLIEMAVGFAEGVEWMGWKCEQTKVLYVNLELDRPSCLHRFKEVYTSLGLKPNNLKNIDIWTLRGRVVPMDKLAPKLIRRAAKRGFGAVIIDPIYKVLTGDENSAEQMAHFTNQFDKICIELGTAVIYCHHHSKGAQGGKRSMERSSGSGVFSRDPDAIVDLIELDLTEDIIKQQINNAVCTLCINYLNQKKNGWINEVSQDDMCSHIQMMEYCSRNINKNDFQQLRTLVEETKKRVKQMTAWRMDGTLREFPKFDPVNLWFDYPIHRVDRTEILNDISLEDNLPWNKTYKKNFDKKKSPETIKKEKKEALERAFDGCNINGKVTIKELAEYMGITEKTIRNRLKEHDEFWVDQGEVGKK